MKRIVFLALLTFAVALPALADGSMCMDCTQLMWEDPDGTAHSQANCCMAVNGHCYEGDVLMQKDVGWGCLVSNPDQNGNTVCQSSQVDAGCPTSGGGGGPTPFATFEGDQSCKYDQYGWCDSACSSCTWG